MKRQNEMRNKSEALEKNLQQNPARLSRKKLRKTINECIQRKRFE